MNKGICLATLIPIRRNPMETSEMVSQLLFGELFEIIESKGKWSLIKCTFDDYSGWIDTKLITYLSDHEFDNLTNTNIRVINNVATANKLGYPITILPGSFIYNLNEDGKTFKIASNIFSDFQYKSLKNDIEIISKSFINTPYLWGGKSLYGIDCSGFTQTVFKIMGKKIPRDSSRQVKLGETINFISDVIKGDLAFFDNDEGEIIHVGIILNKKQIIHASGYVRIDQFDQQGIFDSIGKKYTHNLRIIKRIEEPRT